MLILQNGSYMKKEDHLALQEMLRKECTEDLILLPNNVHVALEPQILYECDRRACKVCHPSDCHMTHDISHAVHFEKRYGVYVEVPDGDEKGT